MTRETGADRLTVTTWSEGTWVAPWAGMVEVTVRGAAGAVVVDDEPLPAEAEAPVEWLCRPTRKAPTATARTTRARPPAIQRRRWRLGGGTRIL